MVVQAAPAAGAAAVEGAATTARTAHAGVKAGKAAAGATRRTGQTAGRTARQAGDGARRTANTGRNTARTGRNANQARRRNDADTRKARNATHRNHPNIRDPNKRDPRLNRNRNQFSRYRPDLRKRRQTKRRQLLGQRDPEDLDTSEKTVRFLGRRIKRLARLDHDQGIRRRIRRTLIVLAALFALFALPTLAVADATDQQTDPYQDLLLEETPRPVAAGYGLCPVAGKTTFSNDWGHARSQGSHEGIDLFARYGTPVIAIKDGRVEHGHNTLGGNVYRLWADDGTYYYGAHLSAFENVGIGRVTAGTVLGYVGTSGDAKGTPPHLHWQIHPGGRDSAPVPPYETANELCGLNGALSGTGGAGGAGGVGGGRSANTANGTIQIVDVPTHAGTTITVNAAIGGQVKALLDAAAADGVKLTGGGFRSLAEQISLRKRNGCPDVWSSPSSSCRVPTATPGKSMHERGLAIDFTNCGYGSRCYTWLNKHAHTYGLKNLGCIGTKCEPWHWSTNGR